MCGRRNIRKVYTMLVYENNAEFLVKYVGTLTIRNNIALAVKQLNRIVGWGSEPFKNGFRHLRALQADPFERSLA